MFVCDDGKYFVGPYLFAVFIIIFKPITLYHHDRMDDSDEITDPSQDNNSGGLDGWGDPVGEGGAIGGAWPVGVGWGPGGAPGTR